jgi:GDPmannose 4,6-dehydratase
MLQQDQPEDLVVGTGVTHSVRQFAERAFAVAQLDWDEHVKLDKVLYRPAEVHALQADASRAAKALGWKPKVLFDELVEIMVEADLKRLHDARAP